MIRIVLSAVIILCTTYMGMSLSNKLKSRSRVIELLAASLEELQTNIAFALMPLPQSFAQISAHYPELAGLYGSCLERQKKEPMMNRAWKGAVAEFAAGHDLQFAECEALNILGEGLGKSDEKTQLEAIEYGRQKLLLCLKEAREKQEKLCPIFNHAGVAGGVMIVLLII